MRSLCALGIIAALGACGGGGSAWLWPMPLAQVNTSDVTHSYARFCANTVTENAPN